MVNRGIKVVKRGKEDSKTTQVPQIEKSFVSWKQGQREIVNTVKGWIAEVEQRRRADQIQAAALAKFPRSGVPGLFAALDESL
jgi:hypothetical protein